VGPISKYISTSIFHSVLYYCFVQYLIAIVWCPIHSDLPRRSLISLDVQD
jgi:hypothetical protein